MRILWFNAGILPEACGALRYIPEAGGGWLQSMLTALRLVDPNAHFCVLCLDSRPCDVTIGNVRYVSFGHTGAFTYDNVPPDIEEQARKCIESFSPDIIHVQGTEYFFGRMSQSVYCGKPVVVSLQGILNACWIHLTGGIPVKDLLPSYLTNPRAFIRGRTLAGDLCFWRNKRAVQELAVLRQQQFFIGRTEWDEQCLKSYNDSARYFTVNENLRPEFYNARRDAAHIRRHSIYCAGAASYPLKGAHWLFEAVALLKDEFPDIQLRIAGADDILSGPKSWREWIHEQAYYGYLRRLMCKLDITKHIIALPSLDGGEVVEELKNAELYVSASLCENSPNSLGEAMLVGTPVVQTFVGGAPSMLRDGIDGKLVPPYDPFALAGAIRDRFLNPELSEQCVSSARKSALKRHDVRKNAKDMMDAYERILHLHTEQNGGRAC